MASKQKCKYGEKCYRKNKEHLQEYYHPNDDVSSELARGKKRKREGKDIAEYFQGKSLSKDEVPKSASIHDEEKNGECATHIDSGVKADKGETSKKVDEEQPLSPEDVRESIKQKYLVEMPQDFYDFWEFCVGKDKNCPCEALKESLGLELVGPFDILAGYHKKSKKRPNFLIHWRYYYDPPEFMTVIKGDDKKLYHLGYYRDDPSELPVFVAANAAAESGSLSPKGDNLFAAIKWFIDDKLKSKNLNASEKKGLQDLSVEIKTLAEKNNYSLEMKSKDMKLRDKKVVCKSFHGAGLVVPVDENGVGYREVPESNADLKKMFKAVVEAKTDAEREKNMDPVQELITLVQFANDECDYGEGYELGMDMFSYGGEALHPMIQHLLPLAYQLMGRNVFGQIIESHLQHRKKGCDLSQL